MAKGNSDTISITSCPMCGGAAQKISVDDPHGGPGARYRTVDLGPVATPSTSEVMQEDVAELLRALGLGDHARPKSCHEVVQTEILPAIRRHVGWHTFRTDSGVELMSCCHGPPSEGHTIGCEHRMGWRPWPPPDGTRKVLAYRSDAGVFMAEQHPADDDGSWTWFACCGFDDLTGEEPTRWRPVPEDPDPTD